MSILQITERELQLQRELDEERRLNSMGAEREYILLGKIAQLRLEVERLRAELGNLPDSQRNMLATIKAQREALVQALKAITTVQRVEGNQLEFGSISLLGRATKAIEALNETMEKL